MTKVHIYISNLSGCKSLETFHNNLHELKKEGRSIISTRVKCLMNGKFLIYSTESKEVHACVYYFDRHFEFSCKHDYGGGNSMAHSSDIRGTLTAFLKKSFTNHNTGHKHSECWAIHLPFAFGVTDPAVPFSLMANGTDLRFNLWLPSQEG